MSIKCIAAAILITMTACNRQGRGRYADEGVLARVGDATLTENDVRGIYSAGGSAADSLVLLEAYVKQWAKRQVKIQEAEKLATGSGMDLEAMVNDYRNSLLTQRLDQYYVDRYMDTLIPASQISGYYNQHRAQFVLDRTIVKGRIVRVPNSYRQTAKLKELMASTLPARQKDFEDTCEKNNFLLSEFEAWVDFSEFLTYLPVTRGRDYDNMLPNRKVQEMSDTDFRYYIQITDSRRKGEQAPLESVEHIVRRIIYNQRTNELIRRLEDSLYNAALTDEKIIINTPDDSLN